MYDDERVNLVQKGHAPPRRECILCHREAVFDFWYSSKVESSMDRLADGCIVQMFQNPVDVPNGYHKSAVLLPERRTSTDRYCPWNGMIAPIATFHRPAFSWGRLPNNRRYINQGAIVVRPADPETPELGENWQHFCSGVDITTKA
jgi:hypothetical protein